MPERKLNRLKTVRSRCCRCRQRHVCDVVQHTVLGQVESKLTKYGAEAESHHFNLRLKYKPKTSKSFPTQNSSLVEFLSRKRAKKSLALFSTPSAIYNGTCMLPAPVVLFLIHPRWIRLSPSTCSTPPPNTRKNNTNSSVSCSRPIPTSWTSSALVRSPASYFSFTEGY